MGAYCPTGTAIDETRLGGSGDIWVADGYGSSLVHRYSHAGEHLSVLTGEEGAGRFNCPHAVYIDRRGGKTPELYIADRGNKRIQVYDLEGVHQRSFGEAFLNSPSGFAQWGDRLVVAELYARLAVLGPDDHLVGYLGADPAIDDQHGWPQTARLAQRPHPRRTRKIPSIRPALTGSTPRTPSPSIPTETSMSPNGSSEAATRNSPPSA